MNTEIKAIISERNDSTTTLIGTHRPQQGVRGRVETTKGHGGCLFGIDEIKANPSHFLTAVLAKLPTGYRYIAQVNGGFLGFNAEESDRIDSLVVQNNKDNAATYAANKAHAAARKRHDSVINEGGEGYNPYN